MSSAHLLLDNFNAGEISPLVGSRFQVEKVLNGCRKLRNFIPHPHGPAFRRPGMEWMGAAATSATAPNLRSFQFSGSTVFVLELTTVGLRVWKDGALVPLLAPVALPYAEAELPAVQMAQVNDVVYLTHPNHEPRRLVRWADNDWRLGVVPWKWPALGDENPGSQALPDQYDVASSYDLAAYQVKTLDFTAAGELSSIAFTPGHNVAGPHRMQLLREYLIDGSPSPPYGWLEVAAVDWDAGTAPATISGPFTASPAGIATNNYRLRYQGPGWDWADNPSLTKIRASWSGGLADLTTWSVLMGPRPEPFIVQPGKFKIYANAAALNAAPRFQLESRSTPGAGAWTVFRDFEYSPTAYEWEGLLTAVHEFRWVYTGFSDIGGGALAKFEAISLSAPYQTSIECSNAAVGTGRTLTANRSVFLPEHVGAFWQLTHRRENAFVELAPTSPALAATGVLTFTGVAVNNQTVTIGSRTYTFKTTLTASTTAGEVLIGANQAESQANLAAAINAGAGAGSVYGSQTAPHADVTAAVVGSTVVVTARKPGTGAHSVALTETMSNASWGDVFLSGGVGANTVIAAAQTAGLRINGRWEVTTYGAWESTLYLERLTASGGWEFVRSWRSNKDRNVAVTGETDGDETLRLRIVAGTAAETSTEAAPRFVLEAADARVDGLVKITAVASAVSATCEVISPLLDTSPTYVWTEGAWSTARGFPRAVTMHENRLWFGGSAKEPLRVWASVTGDIENFRRSSLDDASLSFTPTAGELNPIQWMASQGKELVMGTLGDEWTISGEGQPITPTNIKFERQTAHGSAQVQAVMAGEVIAFVQRGGRKLRRISARSDSDAWSTSDMTVLAEHVTQGGIRQMAYGSHPNAILWAVTGDGKLLGLTLEVEQNVFGWHVHETDGLVESVAVVYGADADEVWLAVRRGSARSIERLDPRVFSRRWEELDRMIFSDAAKVIDLAPASATVGGLAHLEGKTVVVLADGVEHPTRVVSGGSITLAAPASRVVVGLPFTSELQPARREVQTDKGTSQGRLWRVSRVGAYVHDSRGGQVADSPTSRFERLPFEAGAALYSGDLETAIESNARRGVDVVVKTSAPLPLNIGALVLKLDLYGD
jgi:hypothetical protein